MSKEELVNKILTLETTGFDALGYFKLIHFKTAEMQAEQEWKEIEQMYNERKNKEDTK
ncbi:MAG: hypothetical protein IJI57_04470 [Flexilinea sp.]|nr:hypothetical protein [Flexilinea sp.]